MAAQPAASAAGDAPPPAAAVAAAVAAAAAEVVALGPSPSEAEVAEDALHYEGLPLGLLSPTVIDNGAGASCPLVRNRKRFLCYFLHRHLEFRLPEVESLAQAAPSSSYQRQQSEDGGAAQPPAVVWEKPFANRVGAPPLEPA